MSTFQHHRFNIVKSNDITEWMNLCDVKAQEFSSTCFEETEDTVNFYYKGKDINVIYGQWDKNIQEGIVARKLLDMVLYWASDEQSEWSEINASA